MATRRFTVAVIAVAMFLSGCTASEPSTPPSSTPAPSPTPPATSAAAAPTIHEALCRSGPLDVAVWSSAIASTRATFPAITDDRAALALSFVPPGLIEAAGLTVTLHHDSTATPAFVQDGKVHLLAGVTVAPAEVAYVAVHEIVRDVVTRSSAANPDAGLDGELIGTVARVIALDSYLKTAITSPAALSGPHLADEHPHSDGPKRLRNSDPWLAQANITTQAFAAAPASWARLASFVGTEFYRPDPADRALYRLRPPVAAGGSAAALAAEFERSC